jgi:hypothetical protein
MKNLILILFLFLFAITISSCSQQRVIVPKIDYISVSSVSYERTAMDYTVTKIDSIKNWYLIYVEKNDTVFKIASMKNPSNKCIRISVGEQYNLELQKRIENVLSKSGLSLIPMNYLHIQEKGFDAETDVFLSDEKGIVGLYTCKNLNGLCVTN